MLYKVAVRVTNYVFFQNFAKINVVKCMHYSNSLFALVLWYTWSRLHGLVLDSYELWDTFFYKWTYWPCSICRFFIWTHVFCSKSPDFKTIALDVHVNWKFTLFICSSVRDLSENKSSLFEKIVESIVLSKHRGWAHTAVFVTNRPALRLHKTINW